MSVETLLAKHNGFIMSNKARVVVGGQQIIVGRVGEHGMELTPEGEALAATAITIETPVPVKTTTRTRKKTVESTDE